MADLNLNSLYQQLILDHYRNPRNKGEDPDATTERHMRNPVCGDEIKLQLQVHDGVITAASVNTPIVAKWCTTAPT